MALSVCMVPAAHGCIPCADPCYLGTGSAIMEHVAAMTPGSHGQQPQRA